MGFKDRIQHAWNAFIQNPIQQMEIGYSSWTPALKSINPYTQTEFLAPIYNRIAIDVSMARLRHVKVDPKTEDVEVIPSGINYCLGVEANIDQTHLQFIHDLVYSMFDEGVACAVPTDTTSSPSITEAYDIKQIRVGKIVQWGPERVRVRLYNEATGQNEDINILKKAVAIVENPFYAVMNAENSTLRRLLRKMAQLDAIDEVTSSGKLDLIVQVPYSIKTTAQRDLAKERIKEVENQLMSGKHGITYMDATEKITQLNRPVESQLPSSIEALTKQLYNQLGLTQTIFDGTASEEELRIYYSRTVDPIVDHIVAEFNRKFLTRTARTQGHEIQYYRDMFKFVTVEMLSQLGDTVRRNSIMTSNEVRKILGIKPSNDPRADELFNPNIADKNQNIQPSPEQLPGSLTPPDTTQNPNE